MKQIAKHGAVISEYPPEEAPKAENFPKRNRIISGLCQGVVVVECAKRSGALITASRAIAQGRELFALPGKIDDSSSAGPNELIQDGANVVLGATDIIDHYGFLYGDVIDYGGLTKARRRFDLDDKTLKKYGVESRKIKGGLTDPQTDEAAPPKQTPKAQSAPVSEEPLIIASNDNAAIVEALDADTRKIYELLPDGKAFTLDSVNADGADVGAIMTALTVLEISGLVESRPGGAYLKK
jgi:DNA processing protein